MTMKLRFFVSFAIWCSAAFLPIGMAAKTLHAINLSRVDLSSETIKESIEIDVRNFHNICNEIGDSAGYIVAHYDIHGNTSQEVFENTINTIANINSSADDAIFLYYSGNGLQVGPNSMPSIALAYTGTEYMTLPIDNIFCAVSAAPAHLKIIVADCCNKQEVPDFYHIIGQAIGCEGNAPFADINEAEDVSSDNGHPNSAMQKLFSAKGTIAFYIPNGYLAYGNAAGGLMSGCLWQTIGELGQGRISPSWLSLQTRFVSLVSERSSGHCVITSKSQN